MVFILGVGSRWVPAVAIRPGRIIVFPAVGLVALATVLSGVARRIRVCCGQCLRAPCSACFGVRPPAVGAGYRLVKAIRRSFIFVALTVSLAVIIFPDVVGAHLAYYRETLMPEAKTRGGGPRLGLSPGQLQKVLRILAGSTGYGIGTASLGGQYVARIMEVPPTDIVGGERVREHDRRIRNSGADPVAHMDIESGVRGSQDHVETKRDLGLSRGPIDPVVRVYSAFPFTWGGIVLYQNFVINAYFWLLVGVLFRLPDLVKENAERTARWPPAPASRLKPASRWFHPSWTSNTGRSGVWWSRWSGWHANMRFTSTATGWRILTSAGSSGTVSPRCPGPHLFAYCWWFLANHLWRWWDRRFRGLRFDLTYTPGINCFDADVISRAHRFCGVSPVSRSKNFG